MLSLFFILLLKVKGDDMSEENFERAIASLFEVVEVNSAGGIPSSVASDTLKLINPSVSDEQADSIVADCDARANGVLGPDEFSECVHIVLHNTAPTDCIQILQDLVLRMRTTYRRRYLMYDAPANQCAPSLLQNSRTVAMFRELFDVAARGQDFITRSDLRTLASEILFEFPADASSLVKAALGEGDRDLIGFYEFIMVLQPATSRRTLSEMVKIAKHRISTGPSTSSSRPTASHLMGTVGDYDSTVLSSPPPAARSNLPEESPGRLATPIGSRPPNKQSRSSRAAEFQSSPSAPNPMTLHHDLQLMKQQHESAESLFRNALTTSQGVGSTPISMKVKQGDEGSRPLQTLQDREIAALRIENESLQQQLRHLQYQQRQDAKGQQGGGSGAQGHDESQRIVSLENELRLTRAQLAVRNEASQLITLLKKSETPGEALRSYYPDESTLVSKHDYLRHVAQPLHDGNSPISLVIAQYDLVVCGYQALYRQQRKEHEAEKAKKYDAFAAARSIIPVNVPSRYVPASRSPAPAVTTVVPIRWQDLDREATIEMKNTRTLADPLLTDEERHQLRAKLAAQMRSAARHYTPTRGKSPATRRFADVSLDLDEPGAATMLASRDAMSRLQLLAGKAHSERRI